MSTVSVVVTLGPAGTPLELGDDCVNSGLFWSTLILPNWEMRYATAPPSAWVHGSVLLAAVQDSGSVVMSVVAKGTSLADMEAQKAILVTTLQAWHGEFTVTTTDLTSTQVIAGPWKTFPTIPKWGRVRHGSLKHYTSEATFELPVNPVGAP